MNRVAERLEFTAMALYRYVSSKERAAAPDARFGVRSPPSRTRREPQNDETV